MIPKAIGKSDPDKYLVAAIEQIKFDSALREFNLLKERFSHKWVLVEGGYAQCAKCGETYGYTGEICKA